MKIRKESHTCSLEITSIKEVSCCVSTMLKAIAMERFSKAKYCEMVLLYDECEHKAQSAAKLYEERFPAAPLLIKPSYLL